MPLINDESKNQMPLFETHEIKMPAQDKADRKRVSRTVKMDEAAKGKPASVPKKRKVNLSRVNKPTKKKISRNMPVIREPASGKVPEGDVRLTANIREELHLKLKIAAARRRTTIGELIELLVDQYL